MRRSKGIVTAVVATGMMAAVPAAAQAHQVSGGDAQCTLIGNVPTITASARFESFADNDKPIRGELQVDGASVETITDFTFSGPSGTWNSAQHRVAAGPHHVSGSFTWPNQDGASGSFSAEVNCPAAETTPPPSNPSPAPPAPPSSTPPAAGQPAPQPQGDVLGESGRCVPRKLGKYRITVTPKHALHGLVTFHLHGPHISHVRWFIDTRRAGTSDKKWEWLRRGGRDYSVYLWAQERWGEHLWGRHTIEARFRVKDSCGRARAARAQRLYFNHDPLSDDPIFAHPAR